MNKKVFSLFMLVLALLFLTACAYTSVAGANDLHMREQLMAIGFSEIELDMMIDDGISMEHILNQVRFGEYVDRIYNNQSVGPSGEIIMLRYHGGIYFNDDGILTVTVLDAAFNHATSAIAIEEMLELGIIVRPVKFTYQELNDTIDTINKMLESARDVGAMGWRLCTIENRVIVWIDPYTDEQKEAFKDFLFDYLIDCSMIAFKQAVTQEMLDHRMASIASATQSPGDRIVLVGDVEVSRMGIAFSLENRTNSEFNYGASWDLAYYLDGQWVPVPHLPGAGSGIWVGIGFSLQSGGIQQYHLDWDWSFGELPPGRYMFIRDGWLGEWHQNQGSVYALVEFFITEDSPAYLLPQTQKERPSLINLVAYSDVTPNGMLIVIENISAYDIDNRAQILGIFYERYVMSDDWWEWQQLPFLPVEGYWIDHLIQGEGFLPSGGQLEFQLDWTKVFGELLPGEYRILLSLGGRAHPPYPTGRDFAETLVILFTI